MENPPGSGRSMRRFYWAILGLVMGSLVGLNALGVRDRATSGTIGSGIPLHANPEVAAFAYVLLVAGLVGVGLMARFLRKYGSELRSAPPPRIQPAVLLISFLVYLVSMVVFDLFAEIIALLLGIDLAGRTGSVVLLSLQMLSRLGAFALGLAVLRWLTAYTLEDPKEIGWRVPWPLGRAIAWGVGGYCAALPLMVAGLMVWQRIGSLIFRNVKTPEHPITPLVMDGGAAFALAFVLAVVVAPIVEETFFRGMLYNALRASMGVLPASFVSGSLFAIIHPTLPAGFLPIMLLGVVLALLREKTGSLVPGMVCHAINNAVALVLVRLVF